MKKLAIVIAIGLVLLGCLGSIEAPVALIFGWIPFLASVVPRMTADVPSLAVGVVAVILFAGGVHIAGHGWGRHVGGAQGGTPWKARWSGAVIAGVFLLFMAGLAIVGTAHQLVWLFSSERPMFIPGTPFASGGNPMTANNMKQMALAVHGFVDVYRELPVGTFSPEGKMLHSWETRLLPFLPYSTQGTDMTLPWNDPVNQKYFQCIIPDFINPGFPTPEVVDADGYGLNHYSANVHVLGPGRQVKKITDFADGTSNTVIFGEISSRFRPWAQPGNWRDPGIGLSRHPNGFGGPSGGGAMFAMADGSVRFVSNRVSLETLQALGTPSGGEKIEDADWSK